ncbi:hypothetical protein GCM10018793_16080 [Streptomyces sulfonofaciens]|uniref:DNA-directed RNA polymerase specialized sigma24 family protein n=1 Tax=Streptomyces sulfonofaciens TaxID=68272 RepID=A0A919KVZ0_9ACTN|nr:hypothetical protein [Streptomyces sulfonofaciens]GHH74562.1 hypothetical protein GCM10018793_16080 [Streptomyces sulfonofaciens]
MHPPDAAPRPDAEQADHALMEHYPRLARLAYLLLPPALGDVRRTRAAHALVQQALPRTPAPDDLPPLPAQRPAAGQEVCGPAAGQEPCGGAADHAGYAGVRLRLVRAALRTGPGRGFAPRPAWVPLLPLLWGLRLAPRRGEGAELALDERLSRAPAAARAVCVLRALERLTEQEAGAVLAAAGVGDPQGALAAAAELPGPDEPAAALLRSPAFDPCTLRARPTDLPRRRQHLKAVLVATAAALVCCALLGPPGRGPGPDGAAAPPYAANPAARAALDPALLTRAAPGAWRASLRTDYSAWPARGALTGDRRLLRRALAVWARPGPRVRVSATPGTPAGAPPGPAQLLYAGVVNASRVVLLHDGLRIARYAEPAGGGDGAVLELARVDGARGAEAAALVVDRVDGNVRYLTAPWVRGAAVRDLLRPALEAAALRRSGDGVTEPVPGPDGSVACRSWGALQVRTAGATRLLADLGELAPAHLTAGRPGAPHEATGPAALADWAHAGCSLSALRARGVRSVNSWRYAGQPLPEAAGTAAWLCTRAETWRGAGSRVQARFWAPGRAAGTPVAQAQDSPACGAARPRLLAGVLWRSPSGGWYVLAAGSRELASVTASGPVRGSGSGPLLALPAARGARPELRGRLADGTPVAPLG